MRINDRIFNLLKEQGKTGKQLATFLGTRQSTVSGWKGDKTPSTNMLLPICEFLGISIEYLLTGKEHNQTDSYPTEDIDTIKKLTFLSDSSKEHLKSYLDFLLSTETNQNKKQDNQDNIISIAKEPAPYNKETKEQTAEEAQVYIPMLGFIAAGQPIDLPDDYTFDDVVAMPCTKEAEQADFALQIKGDSMYPLIEDGETILVKRQSTAKTGQIVVASINNATTLKKFYQFPNHVELRAINKKYEPIIINNEYSDFRILGVKL